MKFVAVTSCPTGIAHTYMAAEALEQAARAAGHEIVVETQGAAGADPIPAEVIAAADAVIFAADVEVRDRSRFAGKPLVTAAVKKAISDGPALVQQAVEAASSAAPATVAAAAPAAGAAGLSSKVSADAGIGTRIRQWLMTGVSYMIPFVAGGGILIALSFMIGGYQIVKVPVDDVINHFDPLSKTSWAAMMFQVGVAAFGFLVPVLAGFIAFAIADRPGIAPGFVGGALALTVKAGFLGGLAAGVIAGFIALWISRWKVPKGVRGIMPVVVIPLVSTLITGFLVLVVIGKPISQVYAGLTSWLNGLSGSNLVLLGALLGAMMAFDMGGPVNKVAYAFATTGLASVAGAESGTPLKIMAAVMAAGMTPPLAMALATVVRPKLFSEAERENGKAAWILGASFITEGAIPFAAVDPLRVIPSLMVGSATTGALVMAFGNTLRAPHGGIWVTPLIGRPLLYLLAIAIGTVISTACVVALKGIGRKPAEIEMVPEPAGAPVPAI